MTADQLDRVSGVVGFICAGFLLSYALILTTRGDWWQALLAAVGALIGAVAGYLLLHEGDR